MCMILEIDCVFLIFYLDNTIAMLSFWLKGTLKIG